MSLIKKASLIEVLSTARGFALKLLEFPCELGRGELLSRVLLSVTSASELFEEAMD
jgi:hypothetical protein